MFSVKSVKQLLKNNNEVNNHRKNVHKDEYIKVLETKLKDSEKEKEVAIRAKKGSEEEVHRLTEDLKKVKIEKKELRTLKNKNTFAVKKTPGDMYDRQDEEEFNSEKEVLHGKHKGFRRNGPQVQPTQMFDCTECEHSTTDKKKLDEHVKRHKELQIKCRKCGEVFKSDSDFNKHNTEKHKRGAYDCMSCDFQTNQESLLKSHINFKHTKEQDREVVNCDICDMKFMSFWSLRNHKRDIHGPQEDCFFFSKKRCKFGASCWKIHGPNVNKDLFTCFACKSSFKTINELMKHRKREHLELCKPCSPKEGNCCFENEPDRCWFIHQEFHQLGEKEAPPIRSPSTQLNQSSQSNQTNQSVRQ